MLDEARIAQATKIKRSAGGGDFTLKKPALIHRRSNQLLDCTPLGKQRLAHFLVAHLKTMRVRS